MKICLPHFRKFTLEFYRPCSTTNNPGPSVTPKEQDSEKEYAERVLKYAKASLSHTFEDYYQKKRCKLEHVEDMIQTSLIQKPELKDFVMEQLKLNNEEELIEKWKNFEAHEKVKWSNNFESINLYQSSSEDYLSLPSSVNVQFIDNMDNLEKLFNIWVYNSSKRQIVGLDAEWLPYSYNQPIVGASIMQMAFGNFVFILDVVKLCQTEKFHKFLNDFFENDQYIKIGHSFETDSKFIRLAFKQAKLENNISNIELNTTSVLNIDFIITKLYEHTINMGLTLSDLFPENNINEETLNLLIERAKKGNMLSLTSYCEIILGKSIDKSECKSVWTRRPLRPSQIRYAALDAYVMIMLYNACEKWAKKINVDMDLITKKYSQYKIDLIERKAQLRLERLEKREENLKEHAYLKAQEEKEKEAILLSSEIVQKREAILVASEILGSKTPEIVKNDENALCTENLSSLKNKI